MCPPPRSETCIISRITNLFLRWLGIESLEKRNLVPHHCWCTAVYSEQKLRTRQSTELVLSHYAKNSGNKKSFAYLHKWHRVAEGKAASQKRPQIRRRLGNQMQVLCKFTRNVESEILGVNTLYILHQESNSSIFLDRSQADREEFRENWCDRKGGSRTRVKRDGVRGREETW